MTPTGIVAERRLAAELTRSRSANTSEADRRFEAYGADALVPKTRRAPQMPNAPLCVIERLGRLAVTQPQPGSPLVCRRAV